MKRFKLNESDGDLERFEMNEELIEELIQIVGSEEDVEAAAEAAYNDLLDAFERDDVEMEEEDVPEKLAVAALIIKLAEKDLLSAEDADGLIEKYL
ncbi:hypothetical protein UFOVP699_248 [uncultured Caudovirales phage]|uniref:Uncharacterized protein n=1 Tax=uncultured Caudovirales phage TaxID=2100421 RepID=A0A6J5NLD9_9CAUD|nr:hypothetical protein UFOVP699_248 [uncultured Caudovirales phage]